MNLRKQFTSVLTAEDGSYQGKSTDLNKENGTHGNGIIHFIGKRKSNTNMTHENNFAKNLYVHIVNCLCDDFHTPTKSTKRRHVWNTEKRKKCTPQISITFWFVKSDKSWAPQWQKSLFTCCIIYHVFFIIINMLHSIWFTENKDYQVILPQSIFGNITLHKVAIENELKAVTACAWVQTNGSSVEIKYSTKSDSCGETTALAIRFFNNSITITVLGNDWWAFYSSFRFLFYMYKVVQRHLIYFMSFLL